MWCTMKSSMFAFRRRSRHPVWLTGALLVASLGLLTSAQQVLISTPALAHFWYPKECCNDQDCFRVSSMKRQADGSLKIEAGHISVVVPPGYAARPSQDNDAHVCVYRDLRGQYHARCVFLPGVS